MLDPHPADFDVVGDVVLAGEIPQGFGLLGRFDVLVGDEVVGDQGDFVRIEHRAANFFEFGDGLGPGDVVGEQKVDFGPDQLPGFNFFAAGVGRQNFFGHRHSHDGYIPPAAFCISGGRPQTASILLIALR